jgi:hypothetical protein
MRESLLAMVLGGFAWAGTAPAQEAARYSENGISFDYPKGWMVKTEKPGGVVSVTVQNDKGTQAIIQIHPAGADPKMVRSQLETVFRKAFEGKLVPGSEKAARRQIAGRDRDGLSLDFEVAQGVAIHFEFFAFPLAPNKPVVCAVFQHGGFDAAAAKKGFDLIAGSLAEPAAANKPAEVETPVRSIVALRVPAPGGWSFKPAQSGVRLWADRDYRLTKLPTEVEGGALLQRGVGDGKAWLPSGRLTVTRDGTAYAIVRTKYLGRVQLDDTVFRKLRGEGWSEVEGAAETTFPPGEAWEWKVIKKDIKKGDELGVLKSLSWDQPIIFVFK